MNPEVKARWLAALRSGEHSQVKGQLHRLGEGYCCLGVLCEVAIKEGLNLRVEDLDGDRHYDGKSGTLPGSVVEWAGIIDNNPKVAGNQLSEWNDQYEKSFTEIADLVEEHL